MQNKIMEPLQDELFLSSDSRENTANLAPLPQFCTGIDHVAIAVTDLEVAIDWYQRLLNFELVERRLTTGESTSMISAVMKSQSAIVVLIQGTTPESQVSRFIEKFGPGVQHMALSVTNLQGVLDRVEAGGGAADIEIIEDEGIRQVFLRRDPGSGVRIELIEKTTGSFSDKSVAQLFRAFEKQNLY